MIYPKKILKTGKILLFAILFLLLDITIFTILQKKTALLLLCFYTLMLFNQPKAKYLVYICLFISLETFLFYGHTYSLLLFIAPLSIVTVKISHILHENRILPYLFVTAIIAFEQFILEPQVFNVKAISPYTIEKICVNLLIVAIFLKYLPKGKLGDRL